MEPFFDAYRAVKPYLITTGNPTDPRTHPKPNGQSTLRRHHQMHPVRVLHHELPVFWNEGTYFGPAAIVNAHRFIFDSRDETAAERLDILNEVDGVWRCRTTFNCTEAAHAASRSPKRSRKSSARADVRALTDRDDAARQGRGGTAR